MSLITSLTNGAAALSAQSYALQVTGKNIANVNNSNYARETVNISEGPVTQTATGYSSSNLQVQSVTQIRSAYLDQQLAQENSIVSGLTAEQSALQQAESSLGQTVSSGTTASSSATAGASLSSQLTGLFNAFQSLAANPADPSAAQNVVQSATSFSDQLNQTDASLAQIQTGLNSQIQSAAGNINTLLSTIAGLNTQIARYETNQPGSAVDLRDQRQPAINSLAADMSFTTCTDPGTGQMTLSTTDASGNPVALVDGGTVSNTVAFSGTSLTAGGTTLALTSGSVQGDINARDGGIQTLRNNLNALAKQVVTSVNAAYNPTSAAGGNFFAASGVTAGTIALDPSLTSSTVKAGASGNAGDNTTALAVANLANQSFSTSSGDAIDGTMTQFYAKTVSAFGQTISNVNSQLENQTAVQALVKSQQQSVSGVNIDEETTNLMMYQKAFQASSNFITIIDGLLATLVQLGAGT
jgi:flagellar hook-associated protein 1 FlgK